jgi:hypothetical protein
MKYIVSLISFIAISFASTVCLHSQAVDTVSLVRVSDVSQATPNSLDFNIEISRVSGIWSHLANGTFQMSLTGPNGNLIRFPNSSITYLDTSDLPIDVYNSTELIKYSLLTQTITDTEKTRFSVAIIGPDTFSNTEMIPILNSDSSNFVLLGRFRITTDTLIQGSDLTFYFPTDYYQAIAYKRMSDSTLAGVTWHSESNNVQMKDGKTISTKYIGSKLDDPGMQIINFKATYLGQKKVRVSWESLSEVSNKGFIVSRAILPFGFVGYDNLVLNEYLGECTTCNFPGQTLTKIPEFNGLGTSKTGRLYSYDETVDYRGEQYVYKLYSQNFRNDTIYHAITDLVVPNAIISFAQANPNPLSSSTNVEYFVEDDVLLTVKVFDSKGSEIETIMDKQQVSRGTYNFTYNASILSQQGFYGMWFVANPIDDPAVELSRALIKLQVLR